MNEKLKNAFKECKALTVQSAIASAILLLIWAFFIFLLFDEQNSKPPLIFLICFFSIGVAIIFSFFIKYASLTIKISKVKHSSLIEAYAFTTRKSTFFNRSASIWKLNTRRYYRPFVLKIRRGKHSLYYVLNKSYFITHEQFSSFKKYVKSKLDDKQITVNVYSQSPSLIASIDYFKY